MDTGSPWILANNPRAPYWEDGVNHAGNKHYKLATLVRASTAAPHYFDPEILPITAERTPPPESASVEMSTPWFARVTTALLERAGLKKKPFFNPKTHGLFIDGGVTPHNNPSFAVLQMAMLKAFHICWPVGPDNLSVTSIGTGTYRPRLSFEQLGFTRYAQLAYHALMSLMTDAEMMILAQMQWLGESPQPWVINSEIGTLADDGPPSGKMFRFLRYDVKLEVDWLRNELDVKATENDIVRFRGMDDPGIVQAIYDIAKMAARKQIKYEHYFPGASSTAADR
jgi:hypothetical protein